MITADPALYKVLERIIYDQFYNDNDLSANCQALDHFIAH